jgi:ribosomal protein L11 methylase PrmA
VPLWTSIISSTAFVSASGILPASQFVCLRTLGHFCVWSAYLPVLVVYLFGQGKTVMDVGAGSGILSLFAATVRILVFGCMHY